MKQVQVIRVHQWSFFEVLHTASSRGVRRQKCLPPEPAQTPAEGWLPEGSRPAAAAIRHPVQ